MPSDLISGKGQSIELSAYEPLVVRFLSYMHSRSLATVIRVALDSENAALTPWALISCDIGPRASKAASYPGRIKEEISDLLGQRRLRSACVMFSFLRGG